MHIFWALDHVRSDHLQTFVESRYQRVKRLKTGGNIQCDFCSKFFDQKKDLKKHVSLAHPDKTNEDDVEEIYENSENSHSMLRTALKKRKKTRQALVIPKYEGSKYNHSLKTIYYLLW